MRKRSIECFFDNIQWYFLYMLPLLVFVILLFNNHTDVTLSTVMSNYNFDIVQNTLISSIENIFGADGLYALFTSNDLLIYCCYFVSVTLCHVVVDILLLIPRICHRLINHGFGGKHE